MMQPTDNLSILRRHNDAFKALVHRLEAENEALRQALGINGASVLQGALGLTPSGSRILAHLSCGRVLTFDQIAAGLAFDGMSSEPNHATIKAHIWRLRRDLRAVPIRVGTAPCVGYILRDGLDLVRGLMAGHEVAIHPGMTASINSMEMH